jgi:hypothetical protein
MNINFVPSVEKVSGGSPAYHFIIVGIIGKMPTTDVVTNRSIRPPTSDVTGWLNPFHNIYFLILYTRDDFSHYYYAITCTNIWAVVSLLIGRPCGCYA